MAEATPTPARFKRMNPEPYLDKEKFDSEAEALEYLADPTCYAGHSIAVKGADGKYTLRIINDGTEGQKVLDEVGVSGGGAADQVGDLTPEVIETKEGAQQKADTALALAKTYADELIERLMNAPPETLDTLAELATALGNDPNFATTMANALAQKAGKTPASANADGLMSAADKTKLDGIESGANKTVVDSALSGNSENPVQNKAVKAALDGLAPVFLNMSLMNGGTIGADDLAKLKEPESGRPLFFGNFSDSTNQCLSATYNWNGTKLYVTVFSPQPGKVRVENIVYSSDGTYEEKTSTEITLNGDGTKFLNDAGQYVTIPKQERGTAVFFSSAIGTSVAGKGLQIPKSSLKPTGITPIVGKDIVIHATIGVIGLITFSDLQNYYLSYDNGTLMQAILES